MPYECGFCLVAIRVGGSKYESLDMLSRWSKPGAPAEVKGKLENGQGLQIESVFCDVEDE